MAALRAWSLPATLNPPLSGREAIADAVYRVVIGLDLNDVDLFKSAFTQDSTVVLRGETMQGLDAIVAKLFDKVAKLDTTHMLTNLRINIDGARASLTAKLLGQHYRGGTGLDPKAKRFLGAALEFVDLVREDGNGNGEMWKIASWRMQLMWGEGDPTIVM